MTNLANLPPLGQKQPKPAPVKRKPVRRVSKKRAAYLASADRAEGLEHMGRVKMLPCVCCGHPPPNNAHHCRSDGMPRQDKKTIPLCDPCHVGPGISRHGTAKRWHLKYGPDHGFLARVDAMLRAEDDGILGEWF